MQKQPKHHYSNHTKWNSLAMKYSSIQAVRFVSMWIFICQVLTMRAIAQWSNDPNVNNAICSAVGQQRGPHVTSDGSGGAIITWMDDRDIATNSTDIYAQRINASGFVQWTANGVGICTDIGLQSAPQITTDGSGGAIIVWQDNRVFPIPEIFAQRINASGVVQWTIDGMSLGGDGIGQSQAQLIRWRRRSDCYLEEWNHPVFQHPGPANKWERCHSLGRRRGKCDHKPHA